MAENTKIEWTDATWNPITGCSVTSPGCKHCYAMQLAGTRLKHHESRAGLTQDTSAGPVWTGEVRFNSQWLDQPLRWKAPKMIFVCAHSDLFHESVPDARIDKVLAVMALAKRHIFQVLTKRAKRMREYFSALTRDRIEEAAREMGYTFRHSGAWLLALPLPNVWLGVSVEDQKRADERIPELLATPAAVRFLSMEPLLGGVDLSQWLDLIQYDDGAPWMRRNIGHLHDMLDWVIVGGESGPKARPMHPQWVRDIRDQCEAAGVPMMLKQWGEWKPISQMDESEHGGLYKSCVIAKPHENQSNLDDIYGRRCTVPSTVLHANGSTHDITEPMAFMQGTEAMQIFRIGKKTAGRLLDGVQHDGYPELSA